MRQELEECITKSTVNKTDKKQFEELKVTELRSCGKIDSLNEKIEDVESMVRKFDVEEQLTEFFQLVSGQMEGISKDLRGVKASIRRFELPQQLKAQEMVLKNIIRQSMNEMRKAIETKLRNVQGKMTLQGEIMKDLQEESMQRLAEVFTTTMSNNETQIALGLQLGQGIETQCVAFMLPFFIGFISVAAILGSLCLGQCFYIICKCNRKNQDVERKKGKVAKKGTGNMATSIEEEGVSNNQLGRGRDQGFPMAIGESLV